MSLLPNGWAEVQLDAVASIRPGRTPRRLDDYLKANPRSDRVVPFFKVGDMTGDSARFMSSARTHLAFDELRRLGVEPVPSGTIVFPKAGGAIATNKKRTIQTPGAIDLNCMAVVPGPRVESDYLYYWFEALDLRTLADGSILPQISKRRVTDLVIPLPPLYEQRRIVDILEDHLSRLDAGVAGLCRGADHLAVLRLSALSGARQRLLEGGAPLLPLSAITSTALGKMLDAKKAVGDPTRYLRNINVRWGAFKLDDVATVRLTADERERLALRRGDLLVCEGGEPGRSAVWPGGDSLVAYQKALHRVRVLDPERTNVHFIAAMLEEFIRAGRADRMFTGTTIKHLPQEKLRLITIPMPDAAHQEAAVDLLESLDEAASRLREELASQTARAGLLRRALLNAAVSGRLLGRSANMDRVEELAGV